MRRAKQLDIDFLFRGRPEPPTRRCDVPGCSGTGDFRAPRAPSDLNRYYHFCIDHVRAYNQSWNYCQGMSDIDVETAIRQDMCWQRPTWPLGRWGAFAHVQREGAGGLHDGFGDFRDGARQHGDASRAGQEQHRDERGTNRGSNGQSQQQGRQSGHQQDRGGRRGPEADALAILGLRAPVTLAIVKLRYKELVRTLHPDANGGDSEAEERLKMVNYAYTVLKLRFGEARA